LRWAPFLERRVFHARFRRRNADERTLAVSVDPADARRAVIRFDRRTLAQLPLDNGNVFAKGGGHVG
jgi:hypothetical protein